MPLDSHDHAVDPARAGDVNDIIEFSEDSRSGAILSSTGESPAFRRTRSRASITFASEIVERGSLLQVAQARRVRRRHIDREIARHRREGLDQLHIIGDAVGGILVGADVDPTMPPKCARPASRRAPPIAPSLLKPMRLTAAICRAQAEQPRLRIAGLRLRRHRVPTSDKAETQPQQRSGTSALLSNPRSHADRLGKFETEGPDCQISSSGRGRIGGSSRRPWIASRCASSGSSQRNSWQRKTHRRRGSTAPSSGMS